ncbi:hypothetical protein GCM10023351_08240 [Microbacterium gilvum]|uniref:Uncharacterized protein n=1 Tax=Microbacterium gilvum TaxID=1336204 RepID=A0ABP8ZXE2_9MICO
MEVQVGRLVDVAHPALVHPLIVGVLAPVSRRLRRVLATVSQRACLGSQTCCVWSGSS